MARVTHVKAAQQRYETVPVIDPETGEQKRTPKMRDGKQMVTKRGRPIFVDVTVADKSKPLPNRNCGKCGKEITVGSPYKHISPRSGPYGGRTLYRCASCPSWRVWEYSSSLSARLAEVAYDFSNALVSVDTEDEVQDALNTAAEAVREIAGEKRESAQNIEDGFQHETQQSQELNEIADNLDAWADEIESATIPDLPDAEEADCEECGGNGEIDNDRYEELAEWVDTAVALVARIRKLPITNPVLLRKVLGNLELIEAQINGWQAELEDENATIDCEACNGSGHIENDEPTAEQIEEWREEVLGDLSIVDEPPV